MKTNFHNKNFPLSLAFIMRFKVTRKWSIGIWKSVVFRGEGRGGGGGGTARTGVPGVTLLGTKTRTNNKLNLLGRVRRKVGRWRTRSNDKISSKKHFQILPSYMYESSDAMNTLTIYLII